MDFALFELPFCALNFQPLLQFWTSESNTLLCRYHISNVINWPMRTNISTTELLSRGDILRRVVTSWGTTYWLIGGPSFFKSLVQNGASIHLCLPVKFPDDRKASSMKVLDQQNLHSRQQNSAGPTVPQLTTKSIGSNSVILNGSTSFIFYRWHTLFHIFKIALSHHFNCLLKRACALQFASNV